MESSWASYLCCGVTRAKHENLANSEFIQAVLTDVAKQERSEISSLTISYMKELLSNEKISSIIPTTDDVREYMAGIINGMKSNRCQKIR